MNKVMILASHWASSVGSMERKYKEREGVLMQRHSGLFLYRVILEMARMFLVSSVPLSFFLVFKKLRSTYRRRKYCSRCAVSTM